MTPPSPRITIRELAGRAKVSPMTVSRALNNHPNVRKELGDRIRAIAREVGYHPDPMLSGLAAYRKGLGSAGEMVPIAYVSAWSSPRGWANVPHFRLQYEGASRRARELGYNLQSFWARESHMTDGRASRILFSRGIRGLLFAPSQANIAHSRFEWKHFSCIALGSSIYKPNLHRVSGRPFMSLLLAWSNLRRLGYRRIGLAIKRRTDVRALHEWLGAYSFKCSQTAEKHRVRPLVWEDETDPSTFRKWLLLERPDAVMSFGSGPISWIPDAGFQVASGIGYIDLDLPSPTASCAGVYQFPDIVGASAVEQLNLLLTHNQTGLPEHPQLLCVDPVWVDGPTVMRQGRLKPAKTGKASKIKDGK